MLKLVAFALTLIGKDQKNTHKGISGVFWDPRVLSSVNYTEEKRLG